LREQIWFRPFSSHCIKLIGADMDTKYTLGFALVTVIMVMLIGTVLAAIDDSNDPQSTISNDGTIWIIGDFEQFGRRFDTHPHDDPTLIKYTIGDDLSKFPSGLGTDIGSQRSAIKIQFNEDLSEETILVIKWSPGGSIAFEQFRAEVDEKTVGHSQYLQGSSPPKWITKEFVIPITSGNTHEVTLTHLKGDGLNLGAIGLFEKNADALSEILAGSGSINDAKYKNGLSIPMLFLIICGVLLIGYAVLKSKSKSSGEENMAGVAVPTQPEHEEIIARDVESIIPTPYLEEAITKRVDGNSEGVFNKAPRIQVVSDEKRRTAEKGSRVNLEEALERAIATSSLHCAFCGKALRESLGGIVVTFSIEDAVKLNETAPYICQSCRTISCFECCHDMDECKVICRECGHVMTAWGE